MMMALMLTATDQDPGRLDVVFKLKHLITHLGESLWVNV